MDFESLRKRAMEVRGRYAELERRTGGAEWSNLNLMEGFVGDVGDLMKLVMAKEGLRDIEDADRKLEHELSDCLWSVLVLSDRYGIDLEKSFLLTMDELETRIDNDLDK